LSEAQAPGEGKTAAVRPVQGNPGAPQRTATGVPAPVRTSNPPVVRGAPATSPRPSPFESDLARKREAAPVSPASPSTPKAYAPNAYSEEMAQGGVAVAVAPQPETASTSPEISVESLRTLVLGAVQDSSGLLEEGEWELRGNELIIKVAASQTVAELALSADARRAAVQAASTAAGRNLKLRIVGGGSANGSHSSGKSNGSSSKNKTFDAGDSGARARASRDPIVQRMQEKFGAEIRTVIDKRDRQA
ncbi:MAG TPA: hypothetical protein VG892_02110, partial [Terriglobales bacterium]|nr:hypothetical protein [Terriglobales bacterium]